MQSKNIHSFIHSFKHNHRAPTLYQAGASISSSPESEYLPTLPRLAYHNTHFQTNALAFLSDFLTPGRKPPC